MSGLYNEEIKERFLSQYDNEQTKKTIRNVFQNTCDVEDTFEKDLYDFTMDQIGKVIKNYIKPHTASVASSNGRFISQYISWAISEGHRKSNLNPLKGTTDDFYDDLIDKTKKVHYSYSEFLGLLEDKNMHNAADKSFLFLIWYGISGERFSELQQMKQSDIDFDTNEIFISARNKKITVSDECIKYLEKACKEKTYYQYNSSTGEFSEKEMLDSPFLFRNIKSPRGTEGLPIGMNVMYSRLHAMKDYLQLEYLTPNAIKQSGMIKMAVDVYLEEGVLGYEQLAKVCERYDYSMITNNNHTYYNTHLLRQFLNSEIIKELYNLKIEVEKR